MVSTIESNLGAVNGKVVIAPKEIPNWYGIKNVGFISHGEWSSPEIEYNGKRINSHIVEDTMWESWIHDDNGNLISDNEKDYKGFEQFMKDHAEEVYELIEIAMESEV